MLPNIPAKQSIAIPPSDMHYDRWACGPLQVQGSLLRVNVAGDVMTRMPADKASTKPLTVIIRNDGMLAIPGGDGTDIMIEQPQAVKDAIVGLQSAVLAAILAKNAN